MKRILVLMITVLPTVFSTASAQGYEIELHIKGAKETAIYMAVHYGDEKFVRDSAVLDKDGRAVFSKNTPLERGMYLVAMNGEHILDFLISDKNNQNFSICATVNEYTKTLSFKSSPENEAFAEFSRFMLKKQNKDRDLAEMLRKAQGNEEMKIYAESEIKKNEDLFDEKIDKIEKEFPGSLLFSVAKSMKRNDPPEPDIPPDAEDKAKLRYSYYYEFEKNRYWDNFVLDDAGMQYTPIFVAAVDNYFKRILIQHPDSIIVPMDKFIEKGSSNPEMLKFMTGHLFNMFMQSDIMGLENVVVHLIDKYYLSGRVSAANKFLSEVAEYADKNRNSLIGVKAAEMKLENTYGQLESLYDVDSPYTLVYFYEPNCGHCKQETPGIYAAYERYKDKGLAAYAVCTSDKKKEWIAYIAENGLQWTNVKDSRTGTEFRKNYNVFVVPQVYLLDKDKIIIGRRLSAESLDKMLNNLTNK